MHSRRRTNSEILLGKRTLKRTGKALHALEVHSAADHM